VAEETPAATPATDRFPVTLDHAIGSTTIEAEPLRIVTLGPANQDAVLALGVVPVGVSPGDHGTVDGDYVWMRAKRLDLGGAEPTYLSEVDGPPYEAIVALAPDTILMPYSGLEPEEYDRLSQIAPTVPYAQDPWATSWQDQTLTIGKALGRSAAAEELVATTEEFVVSAARPEYAGRTVVYATTSAGSSDFGIYMPTDPRVRLLLDLGFVLPPGVENLVSNELEFVGTVSAENYDTVDADVFVCWCYAEGDREAVEAMPVFQAFGPVARGNYLTSEDAGLVMATSSGSSALSLPWALE